MKLKAWLEAERGRNKALADHLELSEGRVSQMATDGVPVKYMGKVRAFTKGAVTLEDMVSERTPALHAPSRPSTRTARAA